MTWIFDRIRALWTPPPAPRPTVGDIGRYALACARLEIGRGESGGNNHGPDLDRYRTDRQGRRGSDGPWCAAFVAWCLERGALEFKRSHRAKALFSNLLAAGAAKVDSPHPGDVVLWHRGADGASTGHIGIVSDADPLSSLFRSIEGNRGGYPSKVREYAHEVGEALLLGFARLP